MASPQRVGLDHPEVCQGNSGQPCEYRKVPGSEFCPMHAGGSAAVREEKAELRNYRLQGVYAARAKEISGSSNLKNLADEIALMRVTLETVFNAIGNANEMLLYVDKIEKLAKGIERLVETWQKVQERNKELLDRETVMKIFDGIMEILIMNISDPDIIEKIAKEGSNVIAKGLGEPIS